VAHAHRQEPTRRGMFWFAQAATRRAATSC
jgi:hypothetical protein